MSAKVAQMAHADGSNSRDSREGSEISAKKARILYGESHDTRDEAEKPAKKAKFSHDVSIPVTGTTDGVAAIPQLPRVNDNANTNATNPTNNGVKDGSSKPAGKAGVNNVVAQAQLLLQRQKELSERLNKLSKKSGKSNLADAPAAVGVPAITVPSSTKLSRPKEPAPPSTLPIPSTAAVPSPTALNILGFQPGLQGLLPQAFSGLKAPEMPFTGLSNYEAVKRAQELASRWGFQQGSIPMLSMVTPPTPEDLALAAQSKVVKAPVLRLDAQGREVDEHGNVVDKPKITSISTLKVNINKQKKEAFKILRPELEEDPVDNPHFDPRVGADKKKLVRSKRSTFQFVEEGKMSKQAELQRFKIQFGEAKAKEMKMKQAQLSKARADADVNPNLIEVTERVPVKEEKIKDILPEVEWWDAGLLPSGTYGDIMDDEFKIRLEKITIYVEHPVPIEPPAETPAPAPQPLKLTKKEQKKLRTQRRLAKEKDRQEMIRQGLLEPPKPKVKMSNLMKVLGAEATQDPTRLEQEIRSAAAEREQAHIDRNLARKLTPAERREKKEKKLFDDPTTLETIVSVYRVNDLSHPQTRFKVDMNAQENRLTGCVVISDAMTVVVVEGGSKSIKRYSKLMLRRIKWENAVKETDEEESEGPQVVNRCVLVWQGSVAKPSFERFLIQQCRSEAAARKFLADAGVGHYWDLSSNYAED